MLYIVTFKEDKDIELISTIGGKVIYNYSFLDRILAVEMTQDQADELRSNENIKAVEEDAEEYEDEQQESYAIELLKVREFWDSGYTGKGIKIAVLDSGCQIHEDLNIAGGYNSFDSTKPYMVDIGDHGTHTAGIINMQDNDIGYVGVAPGAKLYVVKMEDNKSEGYKVSSQIEAVNWAIENNIDIISQSVSGSQDIEARRETYRVAAEEHGIIICASSGNSHRGHGYTDDTIRYPAKYPFIVGCGATDENNEIRPSSSRGEGLDIVAPGTKIMSTVTSGTTEVGKKYGSKSGTSMSTPYVAGMFALYKEKYPQLNRENLIEEVMNNAEYLGNPLVYGAGMIQPPRELRRADSRTAYVRDLEGNEYPLQATITYEKELNANQNISLTVLPTNVNNNFISNIGEMWHVVDHDGIEYKVIYAKRKGRGVYESSKLVNEDVYSDEYYFLHTGQPSEVKTTQKTYRKNDKKQLTVELKAVPLFFDTLDNQRIYERYDEHMTAEKAFNRIFKGTGFVFLMVDSFSAVEWEGFGEGETKLETFKRALERYKAEFRISGNVIYLEKQIGRDTQFMYRHRLNASNIEQEINAGDMWTYSRGYGDYGDGAGGEDWKKAKLKREYISPLAKVIGKRHAPPVKNGNIRTKKEMDRRLKELVDESLKVSVSADIHDLREQGYPIAQSEMGDRVFLIDERIGLNDEVRVVNQSITKNWKGEVIDIQLNFGNEGISKRYQSNLNTSVKDLNDILDGVKQLPYNVIDERIKNATEALRNAQTEVDFTNQGILSIDKRNPNLMTILNSAGLGVSIDGGATYENAITGEGINASAITAGILYGIRIMQESGDTKLVMDKGELTSYYKGDTTMKFGQYSLDFFNRASSRIGRLIPLQHSENPNTKGLGLIVDEDFINIGYYKNGAYHAVFRSTDSDNVTTVSGPYNNLNLGSSLRLFANRRQVSDGRFSAHDQPAVILDQSDTTNDLTMYFGGFNRRSSAEWRVRWRSNEGQYRTILKATKDGLNVIGQTYSNNFINNSLEEYKSNIKKWNIDATEVIKNADLYEWENDGEGKNYGFVIGEGYKTPNEVMSLNKDGVSGYAHSSLNTKAIQQLITRVEKLEGLHG